MDFRYVALLVLVFSLGWTGSNLIENSFDFKQSPAFLGFNRAPEQLSPSNHVSEGQIHVFPDRIILDIQNASWSSFTDTNSMDPLIDEQSNGLEIRPRSVDDIHVGDVISYESAQAKGLIIHRVVKKDIDEKGVYFVVKGDNNPTTDPDKVRFSDIHGVLVGVVY